MNDKVSIQYLIIFLILKIQSLYELVYCCKKNIHPPKKMNKKKNIFQTFLNLSFLC